MDGPSHLLALKVMRVSRPSLASHWQPFYSSSPSFSAHSTASPMSLQGKAPLTGHPKTLRDFTQANEMLTLPASFGSIQLGETFSSCLCVNNEAQVDVEDVKMVVEMQTATSKVLLAEFAGPGNRLAVGDTSEQVIHHEIKELGQHVLACTVSYRPPPSVRMPPQDQAEDSSDPSVQSFRKFYKFVVTNPLSVKTKAHLSRAPSALMDMSERDKVFLEVHIQNMTQEPIWFERMIFEAVQGWKVHDINTLTEDEMESIFSGAMELLHPQDMRQYLYVLSPMSVSTVPPIYPPGSSIPLGRLDLSWRSSYGEPGRLLTSMLSRRIALPANTPKANQPASALPPYLKRTVASSPQSPSRPGSPVISRPVSPFRNRPASVAGGRIQSPPPPLPNQSAPNAGIDVDILVRNIDRASVRVQHPFTVQYSVTITSSIPFEKRHHKRVVTLAVQHIQPPTKVTPIPPPVTLVTSEPFTRIAASGLSTPTQSPPSTTFNSPIVQQRALPFTLSPRLVSHDLATLEGPPLTRLPLPFSDIAKSSAGVGFCGPSAITLDTITLADVDSQMPEPNKRVQGTQEFKLTFMALMPGFTTFGGLRVLLVDDKYVGKDGENVDETLTPGRTATILKEWELTGELWVSSD